MFTTLATHTVKAKHFVHRGRLKRRDYGLEQEALFEPACPMRG